MSDLEYCDFEIEIGEALPDGAYRVSVAVRDQGRRARSTFIPPYNDAEVSAALGYMEQGLFDDAYVKEFGASLFGALFTDPIKDVYNGSRQSSAVPLRIRLVIDVPEVARIPWELLFDPDRQV